MAQTQSIQGLTVRAQHADGHRDPSSDGCQRKNLLDTTKPRPKFGGSGGVHVKRVTQCMGRTGHVQWGV